MASSTKDDRRGRSRSKQRGADNTGSGSDNENILDILKKQQKERLARRDPLENPIRFGQNQTRNHELDRKERTLPNLHALELDQVRIMNSIGRPAVDYGDELYQFKMKQYKELSTDRAEQDKMLNAQKVQRLRNQNINSKIKQASSNSRRTLKK